MSLNEVISKLAKVFNKQKLIRDRGQELCRHRFPCKPAYMRAQNHSVSISKCGLCAIWPHKPLHSLLVRVPTQYFQLLPSTKTDDAGCHSSCWIHTNTKHQAVHLSIYLSIIILITTIRISSYHNQNIILNMEKVEKIHFKKSGFAENTVKY